MPSSHLPPVIAALSARLSQIGFERTRRALAALALSVFISLYLLVSLNAPEGFGRVFVALSFCYGVAFFAVVAEWFWGRWFATGLAWSGVMIAIAGVVAVGWLPQLVIFGVLHLFVIVALMGEKMAARYDLQAAWRERYKMDDFGVARLQKTITRSAASLPSLIIWALAPKEEGMAAILALAALGLGAVGLRGLIRLRSWGVLSIAGAGAAVTASLVAAVLLGPDCSYPHLAYDHAHPFALTLHETAGVAAPLAVAFLVAALLPLVGSIARYFRRPA